jgi:PEP-CTERM motif
MSLIKTASLLSLTLVAAALAVPAARADSILNFTGSQFDVKLDQVSNTDVQVTVTLNHPVDVFVNSGQPTNHPGFAFTLTGDSGVGISFPGSSPWGSDTLQGPVTLTGNTFGTFGYYIDNPGSGASGNHHGPLVFDLTLNSGISINDFAANTKGYYFIADTGINSDTAESGINTAGTPGGDPPSAVPEPSSLVLLGTGIIGAAGVVRRRIVKA